MPEQKEKITKTISDIISEVGYIDTIKHPSIRQYLDTDYFQQLNEAVKIIKGYSDQQYELGRMSQDILILSAIHVSTAEMIGYLQGYARHAEDSRKVTKSKYAIALKKKRDELEDIHDINIKITEAEIDDASRSLASDQYLIASDAETMSHMARSLWYSIGDFIKILNSAINRSQAELFHSKNQS